MADLDRDAARARCEAATEGPWRVMTETRGRRLLPFAVDAKHLTWRVSTVVGAEVNPADAEFIAHARTDLPAALDEIERLRDAINGMAEDMTAALPDDESPGFRRVIETLAAGLRAILEGNGD